MNNNDTFKGPERRTYYDMDPWYSKNKENHIFGWHQQIDEVNDYILGKMKFLIENKNVKNILEVACGGGNFTLQYGKAGLLIDAFEYSSVAIEMASDKANPFNINFFQGDAISFSSYKKDYYDLVLAKDFLHCITGKDRSSFFLNVHESLKESGLFLLSTHAGLPERYPSIMKTIDRETRINHIHTRIYLDKSHIEKEINENNFEIIEVKSFEKYYTEVFLLKITG